MAGLRVTCVCCSRCPAHALSPHSLACCSNRHRAGRLRPLPGSAQLLSSSRGCSRFGSVSRVQEIVAQPSTCWPLTKDVGPLPPSLRSFHSPSSP
eukprot:1355125-Rhodomonas_salina.1